MRGLRATYDPQVQALYVYLPGQPDEPNCVAYTTVHEDCDGLHYDIGLDGKVVGIEVLLSEPLDIQTNPNTGSSVSLPTVEGGAS